MDDLASAARQYLSGLSSVTSLVGAFPADDSVVANQSKPWIFKDDLLVVLEGTSQAAIKLSNGGGWTTPEALTTPRFRRLKVTVYVDPLRDSSRNLLETSGATIQRGENVFDALYGALQLTNNPDMLWGDIRVTGSQLISDVANWTPVSDGDSMVSSDAFYGVMTFGDTHGIA